MKTVITLTKPIKAHNEEINEIALREPTTDERILIGDPQMLVVMDNNLTGIKVLYPVIREYIVKLAGIPPSSVSQMAWRDIQACSKAILGFFSIEDSEAALS